MEAGEFRVLDECEQEQHCNNQHGFTSLLSPSTTVPHLLVNDD